MESVPAFTTRLWAVKRRDSTTPGIFVGEKVETRPTEALWVEVGFRRIQFARRPGEAVYCTAANPADPERPEHFACSLKGKCRRCARIHHGAALVQLRNPRRCGAAQRCLVAVSRA